MGSSTSKIIKASTMGPDMGYIGVIGGPPGVGKSWFCGSMAEHFDPSEVLVIITAPREVESYLYQKYDLDTVVFYDAQWLPNEGLLKATGYDELLDFLRELRTDTKYKAIVIDNGTEMGELAWHDALEPHGVSSPAKIKGGSRWDPYTQIYDNLQQIFTALTILTGKITTFSGKEVATDVAQPKTIWIPWHLQPPKEKPEDGEESADEKGAGVEYEGSMLPMIKGGFRRKLAALVSAFVYGDVQDVPKKKGSIKTEPTYVVQVVGDRERHIKLPGPKPTGAGLIKDKFIHNSFSEFVKLLK